MRQSKEIGGSGEYFCLNPSCPSRVPRWVNDIDPHVAGLYRYLRDDPNAVQSIRTLIEADLQNADDIRKKFYLSRLEYGLGGDPLALVTLNRFAYGQFVKEQRSNFASFSWHHLRNGVEALTEKHLIHCRNLLKHTKITNWDFSKVLEKVSADAWVFIDPPYFDSGWYNREISMDRHRELATYLKTAPFKFLMTIANDEIFHELYCQGDFYILRRQYKYCGILRTEQRLKTELIVRNYE